MTHVLGMLPGSTFKPFKAPKIPLRTLGPQLCRSKCARRTVGRKLPGQRFEWRVLDATSIAIGVQFWGPLQGPIFRVR